MEKVFALLINHHH